MLFHMKQILVELDEEMANRLERVAPARSRQRSEFIRGAIGKALCEIEEQRTADAYRRQPDSGDDVYLDPRVWEPAARYRTKGTKRK
jgi:predicted DNA-binding protein